MIPDYNKIELKQQSKDVVEIHKWYAKNFKKIKMPIPYKKGHTIVDLELFLFKHFGYCKGSGKPRFKKPYLDRLKEVKSFVEKNNHFLSI